MGKDSFAIKLKRLRESSGLTQAKLADLAGMNQFGIAKLEQGVREPSWSTVQALAKALGVDCTAFADCEAADVAPPPAPRGRPRQADGGAAAAKGKGKKTRRKGG